MRQVEHVRPPNDDGRESDRCHSRGSEPVHRGRPSAVAACIALGATALAVASCGSGGGASAAAAARAPSCLPASLTASAQLPGTSVDVTPTPGTSHADPRTQISFLGAPAARIQVDLRVGLAQRRPRRHAEGATRRATARASCRRSRSTPGEQVTVHAAIGRQARVVRASASTRRGRPPAVGGVPEPDGAAGDSQSFVTMPGVQAPVLTVTAPDRDPGAGDIFTSNGPGPGRYGAMIYTPQGQLVWFDQRRGRHRRRRRQRPDLRRQARPDVLAGQGALARIRPGRGLRPQLQLPARSRRVRAGNGLAGRPPRLPDRPARRRLRHRVQPDPLQPRSVAGSAERRDPRRGDRGDRHQDRPRALGVAQPRPRRDQRGGDLRRPTRRGTGSTSTRSTSSRTATSSSRRATPGPATRSPGAPARSSGAWAA